MLFISSLLNNRQAKIAVRCDSEDQMLELEAIAKSLNLCARVIQDAYVLFSLPLYLTYSICFRGRTQIAAGSRTILGIGPGNMAIFTKSLLAN